MDGQTLTLNDITFKLINTRGNVDIEFEEDINYNVNNVEFLKSLLDHFVNNGASELDISHLMDCLCSGNITPIYDMIANDDYDLLTESVDRLKGYNVNNFNMFLSNVLETSHDILDTDSILDSLPLEKVLSYTRKKKLENVL